MKTFERSDDYMTQIFLDSFERNVILDADIVIIWSAKHHKLKAWCNQAKAFLQFPSNLRREGAKFIADVIQSRNNSGTIFYRVYKGSLRLPTGEVIK